MKKIGPITICVRRWVDFWAFGLSVFKLRSFYYEDNTEKIVYGLSIEFFKWMIEVGWQ